MRVPGATPCLAPSRPPKYEPTYALATVLKKPRSIAYLTSREVTSRFTGGEKRTPWRIFTVTVRPSGETTGGLEARSGAARFGAPGR